MQGFWLFLNYVQHLSPEHSCQAITESTRSTVVYGGNCLQAFFVALRTPGVAWVIR